MPSLMGVFEGRSWRGVLLSPGSRLLLSGLRGVSVSTWSHVLDKAVNEWRDCLLPAFSTGFPEAPEHATEHVQNTVGAEHVTCSKSYSSDVCASLLLCFSASLLICFSTCFSASLLLCLLQIFCCSLRLQQQLQLPSLQRNGRKAGSGPSGWPKTGLCGKPPGHSPAGIERAHPHHLAIYLSLSAQPPSYSSSLLFSPSGPSAPSLILPVSPIAESPVAPSWTFLIGKWRRSAHQPA